MSLPAARIYVGQVMHMRLIPRSHRFRYSVFSLLVDIDRIDEVCAGSRILRHNRFGLLSFYDRDHGPRDGTGLRPWVNAELQHAGLPPAARVEMLCFPRMWGYAFNPLTVYFCHDGGGGLSALVYEVKNTFGEQTSYVLPAGRPEGGKHRHTHGKEMYVSPFIAMDQTYRFDVAVPGERLALRIRQSGPEGETLIATHTGRARPLSDRTLSAVVAAHPLMTLKVIGAIHFEALRLFLKGVAYVPRRGVALARRRLNA